MARRPNILILMADQLTPGVLSAYGGRTAKTPAIDALAAGGVVFERAYCNSPLCAPSRYVFMTGRLPSGIGAYDNSAELPADVPTFAHHLRLAGYRTVLSGKMHFCGPDQLHGFEERLTTDIYPADFGWTPDWDEFETRPSWYHNMSSVLDAGVCVRTNQLDFDEEVAFAARQRLFDIARSRDGRPFLMVVSLTHPHDPFAITAEYWNRYREDEIEPPRVPPIPPERLDPHSRRLRHVCDMDRTPIGDDDVRRARHAYFGACSFVDDQIAGVLQALRDTGQAEDTIIVLLSDHGEMLGERGLWYKMSFFEPACRIPLIVHAPGRFRAGRVAAAVSSVDLLPTLVEMAGGGEGSRAAPVDGRSLLPHLTGRGGHDEVIGEYLAEGAIAPVVMIRRGTEKFIHSPPDPDQLYDLADDPDELENRAAAPAYAATVAAYRAETARRWDLPALHERVVASQRRRRLVYEALRRGTRTAWDHQPPADASRKYMRNHIDLDDLEAMARFPPPQRR